MSTEGITEESSTLFLFSLAEFFTRFFFIEGLSSGAAAGVAIAVVAIVVVLVIIVVWRVRRYSRHKIEMTPCCNLFFSSTRGGEDFNTTTTTSASYSNTPKTPVKVPFTPPDVVIVNNYAQDRKIEEPEPLYQNNEMRKTSQVNRNFIN